MAKVVFMGTPDFAVPVLKALIEQHQVLGVITQPDRPAGRGKQVQESPVKQAAVQAGIPVFQPEKLRKKDTIDKLIAWQGEQPDLYVVAAFGQILPQRVLDIPKYGSINVHASLLPRWRGAAPIHAAIRAGDAESGVTIMKMDAGLDTGPMLSKRAISLAPDETGQSLHDKLCVIGAELLIETLLGYLSGAIRPEPQPDDGVTIAPQIDKAEGRIDWSQDAASIERLVRAFTPWPGTFTVWDGKLLKILSVAPPPFPAVQGDAGRVIEHSGRIGVTTGDGVLFPLMVQLEGKKAVSIDDFARGYASFVGSRLG